MRMHTYICIKIKPPAKYHQGCVQMMLEQMCAVYMLLLLSRVKSWHDCADAEYMLKCICICDMVCLFVYLCMYVVLLLLSPVSAQYYCVHVCMRVCQCVSTCVYACACICAAAAVWCEHSTLLCVCVRARAHACVCARAFCALVNT